LSMSDKTKYKEFDYNNMPALDDDSPENIAKAEAMAKFFYDQEIERRKEKAEKEANQK